MADVAKDNISNSLLLSREYPRSPNSISPASSRRDSLRPAYPGSGSESPTPTSPSTNLTRKRATSLDADAANESRVGHLVLNSATNTGTVEGGGKVCLCQPDPKIPRPRNAFILYRQHYQAQVVALHPGLANPEISKIIGEQWTSQPVEVKNEWKRLAEEEKLRHQRQYPDYRYQPRRAGATNQNRSLSFGEGSTRCPKCNGRYILTPRTPSTPLALAQKAQYDRLLPPFSPHPQQGRPSRNMAIDDHAQFPPAPNNTPRTAPPHPQIRWRPGSAQQNFAGLQINSSRERANSMDLTSASPELKRRRFNNGSQGHMSPSLYDSPQYRSGRPLVAANGYSESRRAQFFGPGPIIQHQKAGMMEPPPRPLPAMHQFSNMSLDSPYDESLRLPPLQTQGNQYGPVPSRVNGHQRTDSQARSVEAMVMTIPYINKVKVLSKISPPLAPPGPTSPVQNIRGAVIAVEGADSKLITEVGSFIHEYLSKEPECLVKIWPTASEKNSMGEAEMTGMDPPPVNSPTPNSPHLAYLRTIQSWHERSVEIIRFITTLPSLPVAAAPSPVTSPSKTAAPDLDLKYPSNTSAISTPAPLLTTQDLKPTIPIALFPTGFSLTLSDIFASTIPITDAYAPVDHWQWMATLWRGIVGPDLTIYVKSLSVDDREAMEEMSRYGGVECRWDIGAVVVRVPVGKESRAGPEGGKVEEKTLRRLGFEVLEGVRGGMGGGNGGRAGFGRG